MFQNITSADGNFDDFALSIGTFIKRQETLSARTELQMQIQFRGSDPLM